MTGRQIKEKFINVSLGCCRLFVFFIAIGPFFDSVFESQTQTNRVAYGNLRNITTCLAAFWNLLANIIELIVCFLVMADCIVIDSISYEDAAMNQTFLQLFKLRPILLRGLFYLIISGIETTNLPSYYNSVNKEATFVIQITLAIGRKILIIPALAQIFISCFRYKKNFMEMQPSSPIDDPVKQRVSKFWVLNRYYEMEEYKDKNKDRTQTWKQRTGRACLLVPVLLAFISSCLTLHINLNVLNASAQNHSNAFTFNYSKIFLNNSDLNSYSKVLFKSELFVPFLSHAILSLVFIVFIVVCLTRTKFVRLHNILKMLILYNCLSSIVHTEMLRIYNNWYINNGGILENAIWFSVMLPFFLLLPVLFYAFTHHPYKHVGDAVNGSKDFFQIILNLKNPTKLHKFFNTLMIFFGISGLFFLILAVSLPWMTIVFNPNAQLRKLSETYANTIRAVYSSLAGLSASGFLNLQSNLNNLKPLFKSPLATTKFRFKVDIHVILFLLPCFLFGVVCVSIGFWRRHSVQGLSIRFILSTLAFSFFVSNVVVGFLILMFKSLLMSVLRLAPLVEPVITEELGWKMLKISFGFSSTGALILCLRTTGGFIFQLCKLFFSKCCSQKIKKSKPKFERYGSRDDIISVDEISVISTSTTDTIDSKNLARPRHVKLDIPNADQGTGAANLQKAKSKLSRPSAWLMALFPALASGIIVIYMIAKRPSLFIANPEVTGALRSLFTEFRVRSDSLEGTSIGKREAVQVVNYATGEEISLRISKRSVSNNITALSTALDGAFLSVNSFDIGGFLYVLNLLMPILTTVFVFLGYILMAMPCITIKRKKKIAGALVFWILRLIIASLSFSQSVMGLIKLVFNRVPFFRLNLKEGPAVHLITVINVVLMLCWIELKISKCKPLL